MGSADGRSSNITQTVCDGEYRPALYSPGDVVADEVPGNDEADEHAVSHREDLADSCPHSAVEAALVPNAEQPAVRRRPAFGGTREPELIEGHGPGVGVE